MNRRAFLYCFLLLAMNSHCKTEKHQAGTLPPVQLRFGGGGGFAGAFEEYTLLESGQLFFRARPEDQPREVARINRRQAKGFFSQAKALDWEKQAADKPGNIYFFVAFHDKRAEYKATWGDPERPAPPDIAALYRQLHAVSTDRHIKQ
jgi:hypothetical protein